MFLCVSNKLVGGALKIINMWLTYYTKNETKSLIVQLESLSVFSKYECSNWTFLTIVILKNTKGDAYKGFIRYFDVYLDKVTILKTRLNWSIQPVEPRIEPKINLIKTKKAKNRSNQK